MNKNEIRQVEFVNSTFDEKTNKQITIAKLKKTDKQIVDFLIYDFDLDNWIFETGIVDSFDVNESFEQLKNEIELTDSIEGNGDLNDFISDLAINYAEEIDWMAEIMIRNCFDLAYENESIKCFSPSLESYMLIKATDRDGVFDDFESLKVIINGESSEIKKIAKTEYQVTNDMMPSVIVEANDMFEAIRTLPYILGQSFPYRMCDIRYSF